MAPEAKAIQKKKNRLKLFNISFGFDMPFFVLLMLVLAVGLVSLFSASFAYAYYWEGGNSYHYIQRQMIFAVFGVVVMLFVSTVDYNWFRKLNVPYIVLLVSVFLLILVRLLPSPINVHRWINLGPINIQPSEIAKFAVVLLFAHWIAGAGERMKEAKLGFWRFMAVLAVVCGLVFIEPHLSGTILILSLGMVMMFIGGTRVRYLLLTLGLGAAAVLVMVFVLGYEQDRIAVWLDPMGVYTSGSEGRDLAWQTVQSLFAIGSGGLMGEGLGQSRQKHLFLPEPQNDFIFSIVCEELGFVGAVIIIVLFAALIWRGFVIGLRAKDRFGSMLAIGLTAQVGIQVLLNLAVVTNTMPNTGISLPFFSYGGSSLIMLLAQMGIILSISRKSMQSEE